MKIFYCNPKMFLIPFTFRNILLIIIFTLFAFNPTQAQSQKGQFINASIGYGISAPYDNEDVIGYGFYAQGEYVVQFNKWFGIRPYAGVILTKAGKNNNEAYKVTATAFLIGGKARVTLPVPWVAPYLETGIGASVGSFETITPAYNIKEDGVSMHIPFSAGLEIGRKHNFDFAFTYYFHPSAKQFAGAVAFGMSFPLNKNSQ